MTDNPVDGSNLPTILNFISAAAGLGTAAIGLVDASKAFCGGQSNFGFGFIKTAIERFLPAVDDGPQAFGKADILRTLKSNWINGVPAADQKAKARAMIHLRLTRGDAPALAALAGVKPEVLTSVAQKAMTGDDVTKAEIAVLGQFDAVLAAVLDEAYERADQRYRNTAKLLAVVVAMVLAVGAAWLIQAPPALGAPPPPPYLGSGRFWLAVLVGLVSAPLAPVAKDLATSLQNAISAVRAAKL